MCIFRNITSASLDQKGINLATRKVLVRWPPKILLGYYAHKFLSVKRPALMGSSCYGRRLLEFDAARIFRFQFAQHYVTFIYGVRIAFVPCTPVPKTGCPMRHAGLTVDR